MHKVKGEKIMYSLEGGKNARILPTVRLTDEDLPEIKGWKVGDKVCLCVEVELMSTRQGSEYSQDNKDKRIHSTFKLLKVGVDNDADDSKKKPSSTGKAFEMEYAAKRNGFGTGSRYDKRA